MPPMWSMAKVVCQFYMISLQYLAIIRCQRIYLTYCTLNGPHHKEKANGLCVCRFMAGMRHHLECNYPNSLGNRIEVFMHDGPTIKKWINGSLGTTRLLDVGRLKKLHESHTRRDSRNFSTIAKIHFTARQNSLKRVALSIHQIGKKEASLRALLWGENIFPCPCKLHARPVDVLSTCY